MKSLALVLIVLANSALAYTVDDMPGFTPELSRTIDLKDQSCGKDTIYGLDLCVAGGAWRSRPELEYTDRYANFLVIKNAPLKAYFFPAAEPYLESIERTLRDSNGKTSTISLNYSGQLPTSTNSGYYFANSVVGALPDGRYVAARLSPVK